MASEKAFRRSGRFMVITATRSSISACRSWVPVSSAVMSWLLTAEADSADVPWPAAGQPGDGDRGDSLAMIGPGRHEPQLLARVRQPDHRGAAAAGGGNPEHRGPAVCRGGRVLDLDRQPGHAGGSMLRRLPRP